MSSLCFWSWLSRETIRKLCRNFTLCFSAKLSTHRLICDFVTWLKMNNAFRWIDFFSISATNTAATAVWNIEPAQNQFLHPTDTSNTNMSNWCLVYLLWSSPAWRLENFVVLYANHWIYFDRWIYLLCLIIADIICLRHWESILSEKLLSGWTKNTPFKSTE